MIFGRCLAYIIISLGLASCWTGKQVDAPVYYRTPAPVDTNQLRFDGYYTNISRPDYPQYKYTAVNEIFFTTKNRIHVSHGAHTISDSTLFTCKFYKNMDPADLGVFITEGNKISAFVPVAVAMKEGAWYGVYNLHFSGTIVSKELITNWKAVPPFPKRINKRDIEYNEQIFGERDMKFVQADSIKCLNPK